MRTLSRIRVRPHQMLNKRQESGWKRLESGWKRLYYYLQGPVDNIYTLVLWETPQFTRIKIDNLYTLVLLETPQSTRTKIDTIHTSAVGNA